MSDVPIQVVVATFKDEKAAKQEFQQLNQLRKEKNIKIVNVAVLERDGKSNLHIKEPSHWGWRKGAIAGGALGAVVGLIAGPVGWATAGGAAIGGLAARLRDSNLNDLNDWELRRLGEKLMPGTSAIVTLIEPDWAKPVQDEMTKAGAAITDISSEGVTSARPLESIVSDNPAQAPNGAEQPIGANQDKIS